jgi:hypothetical protein
MDTLSDMNKQIGTVTIEGDHVTLKYEHRLPHAPEAVWGGNHRSKRAGRMVQ